MKFFSLIFSLFFWISFFTTTIFAANKSISVNLTTQTLDAFLDNKLIYEFPISSGKWYPTPTGTFKPWAKLLSTRMVGGNPAIGTFYDLPNVPYVIYFYQGYAIHGAYWHNNFGHPMSHGCINVSVANAKILYNFIDYDTPIIIFGTTPIS